MVTRQPAYNARFRCLGGDCPDTCCRDWSIVPDGEALEEYKNAPEPLRGRVATALDRDNDGDVCFRLREDGCCALLTEDGLCSIQRDWGEEHLCAHCRAYPRFTEEYGCLTETALAVSCPEAARLLMEAERFELAGTDDGRADPPFEGVDGELLAGLEHSRAAALALLEDGGRPLWRRLADVAEYAADLQDCMDFGACAAMADCVPEPAEGPGSGRMEFAARFMELCAGLEPLRPAWPELLGRRSAELRALGGEYAALCAAYEGACPGWERRLTNLACYLVFRHWHKAVNDGGLYGRAALAGAACLLVYHLCLLEWREKGSLSSGEEAALWSAFSREVEHLDGNLARLIGALFDNGSWPLSVALTEEL